MSLLDDATPQEMTRVRRHRVDLLLLAVEGERVVTAALHPERVVKAPLQGRRLLFEALGGLVVVPDLAHESRRSQSRVVRIAL